MTAGVWFVLCNRARALAMPQVAELLAPVTYVTIASAGEDLVVTVQPPQSSEPADITVGLSIDEHVVIESAEIAQDLAAHRPDRAQIAAADARYELVWDPQFTDDVFEIVCEIADLLASATGGVVYDTAAGRFVWEDPY